MSIISQCPTAVAIDRFVIFHLNNLLPILTAKSDECIVDSIIAIVYIFLAFQVSFQTNVIDRFAR